MSILGWFKKRSVESEIEQEIDEIVGNKIKPTLNKKQLEFIDTSELLFATLPIQLAKDVPINSRKVVEGAGNKFTFPYCPGMFDYSRMGYILPAWADFKFKANKAGVVALTGDKKRGSTFKSPFPMESHIVEGLFKLYDGIPLKPFNMNSPWKVFCHDKDISALLLPAWYHADPEFLDNFYVYPGVVDYQSFHTMNVILAAKRKCQYTIKAGDPLLQIIPFYNKNIICGYGPPTLEQKSQAAYDPKMHENQFYRKNHMKKKSYKLDEKKLEEDTPSENNPKEDNE